MFEYDLIVIGSGSGLNVASEAMNLGWGVALIEEGPAGGTCLNRGCIPSKIWIHYADAIREFEDAMRLGIKGKVQSADFGRVQQRMRALVHEDSSSLRESLVDNKGIDYYEGVAEFTDIRTVNVNGEEMTAPKVLVACGVRTRMPEIPGLDGVRHLTSETVFDIDRVPSSMIIIGGGYKACEFAHFFSAMGSRVTMIGRNPRLVPGEEPWVSEMVMNGLSRSMDVWTGANVVQMDGGRNTTAHFTDSDGKRRKVSAETALVCTGVMSNTDRLRVDLSGIGVDRHGYVIVDDHLRTNVEGVFACGDVIGRNMFRHTANYEAAVAWKNMSGGDETLDERVVPHAVFTHPQCASVGLSEEEALDRYEEVLVGHTDYDRATMGYAMGVDGAFKVIAEQKTYRILGAHACGPQASVLIQQIVYLMNCGEGTLLPVIDSQIIHPALSEVVGYAIGGMHPHTRSH